MSEEEEKVADATDEKGSWSAARLAGVILIVLAGLVTLYLLVGFAAWQSGQAIRSEREEDQRQESFSRQKALAQDDISQGSYNLALRRLEWILERDPENEDAQALRRQAEAALKTALTPDAPATPTITAAATPTAGAEDDRQTELERLRLLASQEQWQELLDETNVFQRQYPDYERLVTDSYLYEAYLNQGLTNIQSDQIEIGIYYFSQAAKLGSLPQEALDYWLWAELYLEGIAYYGVNWGVSASFFRDLCLAAPFYQGACDKLYDSLFAYGEQYNFAQDWCPAVEIFREARQIRRTPNLDEKLADALEGCAMATPTPPAITGTLTVTGTEAIAPYPADE